VLSLTDSYANRLDIYLVLRCSTGEPLLPPCVLDELGSLYNKDAVVHALLNKSLPPGLAHITGLKSLIPLKFTPAPNRSSLPKSASQSTFQPNNEAQFQCPITGQEVNGRFKFVVFRASGLVVSERALAEVPSAVEELVGAKWTAQDIIPINPSGDFCAIRSLICYEISPCAARGFLCFQVMVVAVLVRDVCFSSFECMMCKLTA
jgi:Rtf2 RING-finger